MLKAGAALLRSPEPLLHTYQWWSSVQSYCITMTGPDVTKGWLNVTAGSAHCPCWLARASLASVLMVGMMQVHISHIIIPPSSQASHGHGLYTFHWLKCFVWWNEKKVASACFLIIPLVLNVEFNWCGCCDFRWDQRAWDWHAIFGWTVWHGVLTLWSGHENTLHGVMGHTTPRPPDHPQHWEPFQHQASTSLIGPH